MARNVQIEGAEARPDTGAELLVDMQAAVAAVDLLGRATHLARRIQRDRGHIAVLGMMVDFMFLGLQDSDGQLSRNLRKMVGEKAQPLETARRQELGKVIDTLANNGSGLISAVTDDWAGSVESNWRGRQISVWRPANATTRLAQYTTRYGSGYTNLSLGSGTTLTGTVQAIDISAGGSIELRDGTNRYVDKGDETIEDFRMEDPFYQARVRNIFWPEVDGHIERWLPAITIEEVRKPVDLG